MALDDAYVRLLAHVKCVQVRMMADRGHVVPAAEASWLGLTASKGNTGGEGASTALAAAAALAAARGWSLARALGAVYEPASDAPPPQGAPPPRTAVVFLDRPYDDAKHRPKTMASADQVKAALADAKAALAAEGKAVAAEAKGKGKGPTTAVLIVSPAKLSHGARALLTDPDALAAAAGGAGEGTAGEMALNRVQVLLFDDLLIPLSAHVLVPRHTALSPAETAALLADKQVRAEQLNALLDTDPVAAYYGYQPGQVVRIERPDSVSYRTVVHDKAA